MICPHCSHDRTKVINSRTHMSLARIPEDTVYRRRECLRCGFKFSTAERAEIWRRSNERDNQSDTKV